MRRRKPCVFCRLRWFGWYVRFTHGLLERPGRGGAPGRGARQHCCARAHKWMAESTAVPRTSAIHGVCALWGFQNEAFAHNDTTRYRAAPPAERIAPAVGLTPGQTVGGCFTARVDIAANHNGA